MTSNLVRMLSHKNTRSGNDHAESEIHLASYEAGHSTKRHEHYAHPTEHGRPERELIMDGTMDPSIRCFRVVSIRKKKNRGGSFCAR